MIGTLERRRCSGSCARFTIGYRSNWCESAFASVVDRPVYLPGLAAVARRFPTPVEFICANVLPDHALQALHAVANFFALQDHLPVAEVTNEIEIASLVIDP